MQRVKDYLIAHFEQTFVLLVLTSTILVNQFVEQKLAFLNFYFLPIILSGYYLGKRRAALGAVLSIVYALIYIVQFPESFEAAQTRLDVYVHVGAWAGFLILAGVVVGGLQEKLRGEIEAGKKANDNLIVRERELEEVNVSLKEYGENLDVRVRERTAELESAKKLADVLKAKVEETLYSTMDSSVVNLIIEGRLRNEKRHLSIFFSDLANFTTYSEQHPPEVVIADLNRYLRDMEPLLLAYKGHIDKYMGDGIMCEFGAPLEYETHELMAVLAGVKMQEQLLKKNHPWQMRIGIASGSTLTGLIGSKRQTYTAIGDVVNLASRLEKACAPGSVLVERATFEKVSRYFHGKKKRDLPAAEQHPEIERQLNSLHAQMANSGDPELSFSVGELYLQLQEPAMALDYFEKAVQANPAIKKFKIAYADAGIKLREQGTITVKGRRSRVEAYEIAGLKDPLLNPDKFPAALYKDYGDIPELNQIPQDIILPVEALDGSIGHSRCVAMLSFAMSMFFDMSDRQKQELVNAALMADIGKDAIPHHLLNRKGGLSGTEFEATRNHPVEGVQLLRKMGYDNEDMLAAVLHSHEYFRGSGYPDGLQGDDIPLASRIIAVADAYDALTSYRPYRDPWERNTALDEIRRGVSKGMYDPKVAEALFSLMAG